MGFFSRRVDCGSLDILPERDSCLPGEAISGMVMLHLTRPLTDALLTVAFIGHEDVSVTNTDDENGMKRPRSLHTLANLQLVRNQRPLAAGDVSLPFAITVPQGLPPTKQAEYVSEMESDGIESLLRIKISYSLQCELTVRDASATSLKQKIPITVYAWPTARPVGEPVTGEASRTFGYNFFTEKGSCHLRATLDNNVVSVGSRLSAQVLLGDATEFVLRLPVSEDSALKVKGTSRLHPFDPSEAYHHFSLTYEVLVECRVRSCETVVVRFPVTLLPEGGGASP